MRFLFFFATHWYASIFFQTFFLHRYAAHRHFSMSRSWEKVFFVGCFISMGSSYISAYAYGIMHRLHHTYSDKEGDPHSPVYAGNIFKTMLQTRNSYFNIYCGKTIVPDKFKKDLPQWSAFDKIAHNWITRFIWIAIYFSIYIYLATAWWMYLLLPFTIIMATLQGAGPNWWAHKFGYANYKTGDDSKNFFPIDLIYIGEAYHNNHHKFPGRVNYASRWFEIDISYYIILLLSKLKVIQLH